MKEFFNFRKSKLLLLTLLACFVAGVSPAWADKLSENFNSLTVSDNSLSNGWFVQGATLTTSGSSTDGWGNSANTYELVSRDADGTSGKSLVEHYGSQSGYVIIPKELTGTISFKIAGTKYNQSGSYAVYPVTKDGDTYTVGSTAIKSGTVSAKSNSSASFGTWTTVSFDYSDHSMIALKFTKAAIDDFSAEIYEQIDGPALTVKDGSAKIASDYSYNFGLATAGTEKTFTLTNPGTEAVTVNIAATNGFGVNPANATIAAGGEQTLTVTMADATATGAVTITPTASGVDAVTINVSGTIRDANKVYLDFADGKMPEGWTSVKIGSWGSDWAVSEGYISQSGGSSSYASALTSPKMNFEKDELIAFESARYGNSTYYSPSLTVEYSLDGTIWTAIGSAFTDDVYGTWTPRSVTIPVEGVKYIRFNGWYIHLHNIYGGSLPVEPKFGFEASDYAFGVISENTTSTTFTITNSGLAPLTGVSVSSSNDAFTVSSVPATISAGESATFTVTMSAANTGVQNGVITVSAEGFDDKTFNVSGVVMPEGYDVVDFNTAIPSTWENQNNGWSIQDGAAKCTGKYNLTSPKLDFSADANPFFVMKVKASDSGNGDWVTIEGSADNGATWTAFDKITKSYNSGDFGANTGDYSTIAISIPNTVNKIRFNGYYVLIDEIAGLKYSTEDPKLGIYTDADCTVAAATTVTKAYGFVTEAPEAVTYYIKNDGTGTLTLSKTDADGFTATLDKTELGAGEKALLTVSLPVTSNGGYHKGNVVVTAADELGNFTVALSGVVVEEGKLNLNFATDNIPASWTAGDWSKSSSGYMEAGYSSTTMQTSTLVAKANETLAVEAKQNYTGSYTFGVKYRKVGADEWTDLIPAKNIGTDWTVIGATIAEAGNYELQFTGNYTQIRRIYGLEKPEAPEMVVYDGEAVAAATYSFGKVTDEADAEHTFTVKNEGLATLTGLKAELSGDNADHYSVAVSAESIEAGESATVTVKQLKDNLGAHSATLTISATGLDSKEIALSGTTVDHTALDIDFDASSEWPAEILKHGDNWSVYYSSYTNTGYAQQTNSSTASSLITTPLTVSAETDKLTFEASYDSSSRDLTVRYTQDGGQTWTDYNFGTEETPVTSLKDKIGYSTSKFEITNLTAGTYAFDFFGKAVKLDNISGDMKVTTAPMVDFATVEDNINGKNLSADATATYTLQNFGNADYVATVAATGVSVEATGDDVTFEANTLTVPAGKTATITVTMAFAAPYGEKTGSLKLTSESWVGDITVDYTAETIDPTSFLVDFADNQQPAGWYSESWTYDTGAARIYGGIAKPMITEKIGAESGKNVISFDAKVANGSDEQTLSVYTSADRQTWSEAQTFTLTATEQNFQLTALAAGEYYVKFEALNAIVDNIKGVKKLDAPEHDLYYVGTTWPTGDVTPGKSYTATVSVASLRADETVTAQLFFGENKVAELTEQTIANGATKTFTLTGNAPAAGTYDVYAKVFNADGTVETEHQSVTVADTRLLNITAFTRTSEASVVADEDNKFTATFSVTVENTGTATLTKDEVTVTLTDGTDAYEGVTTTWADETLTTLAAGESATLTLSVTLTAESTSYSFKVKENVSNTEYFSSLSVSVTPYVTVALSETESYDATTATYGKVTLNRPFIAGWNTLVLPFDVDAETFAAKFGESAALYTFTSNNNGELTFTKTTEGIKAGTPYLLSLNKAITGAMTFEKVNVQPSTILYKHDVASNGAEFKGNYVYQFDMEGKYGVTPAGKVQQGAAGSTMKAFRAYITMPEGQQARIALFDQTTGISRVLTASEIENMNIFRLNGQRADNNAKGVVIVNGRKVVRK